MPHVFSDPRHSRSITTTANIIKVKCLVLVHVIEYARLIDRTMPLKRATPPRAGNLRAYTYEQVIANLHNDRTKCHLA